MSAQLGAVTWTDKHGNDLMAGAWLCDESGRAAFCLDGCGQLHSPYWSARKSAALHRHGRPEHRVKLVPE